MKIFSTQFADPRRNFLIVLLLTTLIKFWLAVAIPITGDEAYYYKWGMHLDWGYYDHPPMGGWLLWLMQQFSSELIILRLPAILLWVVIALGMMDIFRRLQPEQTDKAWQLGSLFLLLPFTWALTLVTTDTPLIFFLYFSAYAFLRSELENSLKWTVLCGVLLGLALLSKYFAALLAISYAAYYIFLVRTRTAWLRLLIIAVFALPFFIVNLFYNSTDCWNNILFNVINRNQGSQFSFTTVGIYLAMMLYLIMPWLLYQLYKNTQKQDWIKPQRLALVILFILPFTLFLALSFYKTVGLHWVLAFLPFVFIFVACVCAPQSLGQLSLWTLALGVPHIIALAMLAHAPTSTWQNMKLHAAIVMHKETPQLLSVLMRDMPEDGVLMTRSYSSASLFGYYERKDIPVFGMGSFHARMDDNLTDFHQFAGKTIRVFDTRPITQESMAPFFEEAHVSIVRLNGARYWLAEGKNFKFDVYRDQVLSVIAASYYRIPAFLPQRGCKFLEQYDLPAGKPIEKK